MAAVTDGVQDGVDSASCLAHVLHLLRQCAKRIGRRASPSVRALQDTYKISRRIEAEERALDAATMVITSTQQEIDLQWCAPGPCAHAVW
jgi:hypothetical protein